LHSLSLSSTCVRQPAGIECDDEDDEADPGVNVDKMTSSDRTRVWRLHTKSEESVEKREREVDGCACIKEERERLSLLRREGFRWEGRVFRAPFFRRGKAIRLSISGWGAKWMGDLAQPEPLSPSLARAHTHTHMRVSACVRSHSLSPLLRRHPPKGGTTAEAASPPCPLPFFVVPIVEAGSLAGCMFEFRQGRLLCRVIYYPFPPVSLPPFSPCTISPFPASQRRRRRSPRMRSPDTVRVCVRACASVVAEGRGWGEKKSLWRRRKREFCCMGCVRGSVEGEGWEGGSRRK